ASAKSEWPAGWTTTSRPQRDARLGCWSIDSTSRWRSQMWMRSVPLTASIATGPKTPDVSVISRYRGSRLGFGGCRLFTSWYAVTMLTIPWVFAEVEHERDVERDE